MSPRDHTRPTGRRAGDGTTRQALLDAASRQFAEHGYDGASLRGIAREAGVDPAMVRHFFGNKNSLFLATLAAGTQVQDALSKAFLGDPAEIGRRAVDAALSMWEEEPTATTLRALFRSAVASSAGVPRFVETMAPRVFATLGTAPDPRMLHHVAIAGSQMLGVAIGRFVLELAPLVAMTREEIVDAVAPSVQPHLERVVELARAASREPDA